MAPYSFDVFPDTDRPKQSSVERAVEITSFEESPASLAAQLATVAPFSRRFPAGHGPRGGNLVPGWGWFHAPREG